MEGDEFWPSYRLRRLHLFFTLVWLSGKHDFIRAKSYYRCSSIKRNFNYYYCVFVFPVCSFFLYHLVTEIYLNLLFREIKFIIYLEIYLKHMRGKKIKNWLRKRIFIWYKAQLCRIILSWNIRTFLCIRYTCTYTN